MDPDMVTRTIQLIIVPVVMITSSSVLILFLAGVASLLVGSFYAVFDVYLSHSIFTYETGQLISMAKSMGEKS